MNSQSVIHTTAKNSAFRINKPNSQARTVKAIFLDDCSDSAFNVLTKQLWEHLTFYTLSSDCEEITVTTNTGEQESIVQFTASATIIVLFTSRCDNAESISNLGEQLNINNRMPTTFILDNGDANESKIASFLKAIRPYSAMLVRSDDEEYMIEMLTALRA